MVGILFENKALATVSSAAAVSGIIIGALLYRKYLKNKTPTNWTKIGEVEKLCIYPVKSFKGIQVPSFQCTPRGAKVGVLRDRSFVVIDCDGKFVSGRDYPKMTLLTLEVCDETSVKFSSPDFSDSIELNVEQIEGEKKKLVIWDVLTEGIDCGEEIAIWLSKCILGETSGLRLLYCGFEDKGKAVNERIASYSKIVDVDLKESDGGLFSDGVSYHLISEASIKELNSRLDGAQVSAMNFRPNLIVKGDMLIPFEEDNWKWVKVGNVIFQCIAPCIRCLFTTVDPSTGKKSEKNEPLASLRRYRFVRDPEKRKILTSPAMGIYLGLRSQGKISVGDEVFISQ